MFELLCSLSVDAAAGRAVGEAFVPADHPLFADHFPAHATLPGTLAMELAAQVAGPLAEEAVPRSGPRRFAILGMIRDAKFLRPVPLPARVEIEARVQRSDLSQVTVAVTARVGETQFLRGELLLAMIEADSGWDAAIALRDQRVGRWKRAAEAEG